MQPNTPAPTTSQQALAQLQQYNTGLPSSQDIINSTQNSLGVPAAQQQVSGLRSAITNTTNLLNNVAPGVMGRTGNSIVTDAQANRMIQNEQAPISTQLSGLNTQYGDAESDYSNLLGQANTQAQAQIGDQASKQQYLQSIYDALYGQEQDAAKLAEQKREFDASQAAAGSGGIVLNLGDNGSTGSTGGTSSALPAASIIQNGSSFNFKDAQGQPISAAQYAQLTGIGYRDLLSKMAGDGDANAKAALAYVGNDAKFGAAPDTLRGALSALGATGNYYATGAAYTPATSALTRGTTNLTKGLGNL